MSAGSPGSAGASADGAAGRVLPEAEALAWVLAALARGPRTTREVDELARSHGVSCPDGTARFLARLHRRGLVEGRLEVAERTWRWWIPGRGPADPGRDPGPPGPG